MANMKVGTLIEILSGYPEEAEVRLMEQLSWPFEYSVRGVCCSDDLDPCDGEGGQKDRHPSTGITPKPACVYLVEGRQLSYGNKDAWDVC